MEPILSINPSNEDPRLNAISENSSRISGWLIYTNSLHSLDSGYSQLSLFKIEWASFDISHFELILNIS